MSLKTFQLPPLSSQKASSIVVFLHGLGDSGSGGLLEIGRLWQQSLPNTLFLCPDAPFAFDMAPPDFGGRQWFSLREFSDNKIEEGVKQAAPLLTSYLDQMSADHDVDPSKLALVGFSQGTMMALHVGLRYKPSIAAIVGYSGLLAFDRELKTEKTVSPPILLVHGQQDDVVPFKALEAAQRALKAANLDVETLVCPKLGHSIDDDGIRAGQIFLRKHLYG